MRLSVTEVPIRRIYIHINIPNIHDTEDHFLSKCSTAPQATVEQKLPLPRLEPTPATLSALTSSHLHQHLVVSLIISDQFNSRVHVDLINFESEPDGEFKYIMTYQDHLTKFVFKIIDADACCPGSFSSY